MTDIINHPAHYADGRDHEPIDVIIDWDLGYLDGQVVKYLSRLGRKDSALQDAKKAQFYMNRLVEELEKKSDGLVITGADIKAGSITINNFSDKAMTEGSGWS
ncbi:DUF3310 domain-containing protein [Brevibacterium sp. CFH 10365]|uniref:DUF3310 domain-containing protein n=1 Tax=Brevibacterium sp. CFH 10365 TaxID=2585207 RepID=UPI00126663C7|nr:DUF3310 domain-containing protein [Brevibacterium sp. CFH 10365]